jgi:tryptophan-rich sensory protein
VLVPRPSRALATSRRRNRRLARGFSKQCHNTHRGHVLSCGEHHQGSDMTLPIIVAVVATLFVLGIGGLVTNVGPWYQNIRKPSWNPPNWVFGPAWTIILGLAAWSGVLAWLNAPTDVEHQQVIVVFAVNIVFHMLWSPLFFNLRRPDWALIEIPFLWFSIVAMMVVLAPFSPLSAWLLLPYVLWVAFAAFLNLTIVRLNRPFNGQS